MRILVDYRPALRARTGVGEYVHELVRAYTAAHRDVVVLFTSSWKDRPDPHVAAELRARVVDRRVPVRLLNYLWHRAAWPPVEMLAGRIEVVHSLHPLLIPSRHAAQIVTIHDLFFLDHAAGTRAEIRRDYPELSADHARRADAVITPSHHTASRVVERFGVRGDRVYVCAPGAPAWKTLGGGPNLPADGYILFVGTLEPRKNVGTLLDAYQIARERMPSLPRLVLAGGATPAASEWLARVAQPPLQGAVEHLGYVPDTARERLYAGARALVLPSLDEGFGLPALEAMSAGIPVIASNRGSLPEVVGSAGTLIDATDVRAWADALTRVATDTSAAHAQACSGLERARTFTWDRAAETLHRAYRDAAIRRRER